MYHHRHWMPEDEQAGKKAINDPGRFIRKAQLVAVAEPRHWDCLSRTELAEMREAVPHCSKCQGSILAGSCILCGREVK